LIIETFPVGPLQCNCTILGDPETGEAIVIDPGDEAMKVLERLSAHGLKPKAILITHTHLDHVGGNHEVRERTGARVMLHEKDLPLYDNLGMQAQMIGLDTPVRGKVDEHIHQGDVIFFGGKGDSIEVLHTPGHTPGSCSFFLGGRNPLFSGDTLFRGDLGRTKRQSRWASCPQRDVGACSGRRVAVNLYGCGSFPGRVSGRLGLLRRVLERREWRLRLRIDCWPNATSAAHAVPDLAVSTATKSKRRSGGHMLPRALQPKRATAPARGRISKYRFFVWR